MIIDIFQTPTKYDLSKEQINIILSNSDTTEFIDQVFKISKIDAKKIINYFISSIYLKINKENLLLTETNLSPKDFCLIIDSIENNKITKNNLKFVIDEAWNRKESISKILDRFSNKNDNDEELIEKIINNVIEKNKKQVKEYKNGKTKIIGFFVGQVLKDAKGSDPNYIKDKIIKILDSI